MLPKNRAIHKERKGISRKLDGARKKKRTVGETEGEKREILRMRVDYTECEKGGAETVGHTVEKRRNTETEGETMRRVRERKRCLKTERWRKT